MTKERLVTQIDDKLAQAVSRSQLLILAKHRRQHRRSALGRKSRRKRDQGIRLRSRYRSSRSPTGIEEILETGPRRYRRVRVQLAGAAQHRRQSLTAMPPRATDLTPATSRAIVQAAIGGSAGDPSTRRRPELSAGRSMEARVPPDHRGDAQHPGQRSHRRQCAAWTRSRSVEASEGASFIYRGDLQRYVPVRFSVSGRDLAGRSRRCQGSASRKRNPAARRNASRMGRASMASCTPPTSGSRLSFRSHCCWLWASSMPPRFRSSIP